MRIEQQRWSIWVIGEKVMFEGFCQHCLGQGHYEVALPLVLKAIMLDTGLQYNCQTCGKVGSIATVEVKGVMPQPTATDTPPTKDEQSEPKPDPPTPESGENGAESETAPPHDTDPAD